jgi:hypothetical protein
MKTAQRATSYVSCFFLMFSYLTVECFLSLGIEGGLKLI